MYASHLCMYIWNNCSSGDFNSSFFCIGQNCIIIIFTGVWYRKIFSTGNFTEKKYYKKLVIQNRCMLRVWYTGTKVVGRYRYNVHTAVQCYSSTQQLLLLSTCTCLCIETIVATTLHSHSCVPLIFYTLPSITNSNYRQNDAINTLITPWLANIPPLQ